MDKTKQLVEGSIPATPHETEATPTSAPATTTGHDDYNNTDRHRDHYHHNSDRRSRGDRSDHDRRRHDDSDRRRRRSRHDHDGVGDGDGRRLDGDDRRADGPPPYNWDQSNPSSDRRMGHPRHPPPGVSRSPPRDPGHSRRGPPPRY
ncbi:hypothetical protein MHU86_3993 [Fragilaria crotonensis]|nr:hypothetical protein MHU86_3993 [Fragilaria crotonensis]